MNFSKIMASDKPCLIYSLIPTNKRLTFDIHYQDPACIYMGADDGDYFTFTAPSGVQIISRSRMDIQTDRLYLLGAKHESEEGSRSGSMVFSDNDKRDKAAIAFHIALSQWGSSIGRQVQSETNWSNLIHPDAKKLSLMRQAKQLFDQMQVDYRPIQAPVGAKWSIDTSETLIIHAVNDVTGLPETKTFGTVSNELARIYRSVAQLSVIKDLETNNIDLNVYTKSNR